MSDAVPCRVPCTQEKVATELEESSDFWQSFTELAASHPAILKMVLVLMEDSSATCLRGVNRAMRTAVNRTVCTVICTGAATFDGCDVATVFPEATALTVCWIPDQTSTALFLNHIIEASPEMVRRVHTLKLRLSGMPAGNSLAGNVTEFLSWCTSLHMFVCEVFERFGGKLDHGFYFEGEGRTPDERRAHMQQQLAMLPSSPNLLAPSSWGACGTLTRLKTTAAVLTPGHGSLLAPAMQATSLVSLNIDIEAATSLGSLQDLSSLCRLTSLLICHLRHTSAPSLLGDLAAATSLQALDVATDPAYLPEPLEVPVGWARLSLVTRLRLDGVFGQLSRLSALSALQDLSLHIKFGSTDVSLTAMFALTRLTSLLCYSEREAWQQDAPEEGSMPQRVVAPAAWREGLHSLTWSCVDSSCIPVVAQLTCLASLTLCHVLMTPELCRALCDLPRLTQLGVLNAAAAGDHACPSIPRELLPTLPARPPPTKPFQLLIHRDRLSFLHMLARWTDLPHPILIDYKSSDRYDVYDECLAVTGWGINWVISALECPSMAAPLLLVDDADIGLLLEALEGSTQPGTREIQVCLGKAVSKAAFCSLLSSERLPQKGLAIVGPPADMPPYVDGWLGNLELTTGHFVPLLQQSPNASLHSLSLTGCQQVTHMAMVALATAAPQLRQMELYGADGLGDGTLAALAVGCSRLVSLKLRGARRVTTDGVWTLMRGARALRRVGVQGMRVESARQLHAEVVAISAKEWIERYSEWRIVAERGGLIMERTRAT